MKCLSKHVGVWPICYDYEDVADCLTTGAPSRCMKMPSRSRKTARRNLRKRSRARLKDALRNDPEHQ